MLCSIFTFSSAIRLLVGGFSCSFKKNVRYYATTHLISPTQTRIILQLREISSHKSLKYGPLRNHPSPSFRFCFFLPSSPSSFSLPSLFTPSSWLLIKRPALFERRSLGAIRSNPHSAVPKHYLSRYKSAYNVSRRDMIQGCQTLKH